MSPLSGPRPGPSFPRLPTNPGGLEPVPQLQALYGMAVLATEFPSFVEVFEAVETGVGAGTYGTSASRGKVASMSAGWTIWSGWAPNDGLRRKLKARHVKDGCTSSSFTSEVTVTPWSSAPLPTLLSFVDPSTGKIAPTLIDQASRPVSSDQRFRTKLNKSGNQSISNNTNTTLLFDTEVFDVGGLHSTVSNTGRVTIPTGGDTGVWDFRATICFAASGAGTRRLFLQQNGVTALQLDEKLGQAGVLSVLKISELIAAPAVGDYFELIVFQDSGGALNAVAALCWFQAFHLF